MISEAIARQIKLLVLDVDGVLTDGTLYIGESGEAFKVFNVKDGVAIQLLRLHGIEVAVLSGKSSLALERRCNDLGINLAMFGCKNKKEGISKLKSKAVVEFSAMAFCGDDVIDIPAMELVGFSACPADAHSLVKTASNLTLSTVGGAGVVRDLADRILEARCGSLALAYEPLLSDFVTDNAETVEQ